MKVRLIANPDHNLSEVEKLLRIHRIDYETIPTIGDSTLMVEGECYSVERDDWREGIILITCGEFREGVFQYKPRPGKRRILRFFADNDRKSAEMRHTLKAFEELFGLEFEEHFAVGEYGVPSIRTEMIRCTSYGYETYIHGLREHMMFVFGSEEGSRMICQYDKLLNLGWKREFPEYTLRAVG